jgi:acetoacetyl-CoA reductase
MIEAPLVNQVALVTGGSGGIGTAILASFREAGARGVSIDLAEPADGGEWIRADVSDEPSIAQAIGDVETRHGRLDLLVHAAGIAADAVVWKLSAADWDRVHAVNLRGAFLLLRYGIPALRRAGRGRVVLVGSINGSRGKFGTAAYAASKAGLIGLARSVARETGRFGIRVNVIEPGWVHTPLTAGLPPAVLEEAVADRLLGGILEPQDVAAAVLFLCGPAGRSITGQVLRVDGGQYLGGW